MPVPPKMARVWERTARRGARLRALVRTEGIPALREVPPPPFRAWSVALALLPVVVVAARFWGTAVSTSNARIAALWTVEPYAMAVYEQIVYNFGHFGVWSQTVHGGYDDDWSWSGHRSLVLFVTTLLYRGFDNPYGLASIQIAYVALGAVPAALLGRRAFGGDLGLAVGGLLYLLSPAVLALALQDYQDLVAAVPALLTAAVCFRARGWGWVPLGALVGVAPREETVPLVFALALLTWPEAGWRRWLLNVGVTGGAAALYTLAARAYEAGHALPADMVAHDMPLQNAQREAIDALLAGEFPGLDCPAFYLLALGPLALLGLLAPAYEVVGLGLVVLHLTVRPNNGVDRDWFGHAHHMAPAVAFLVLARIQGAGRLLRWVRGRAPDGPTGRGARLRAGLVGALVAVGGLAAARAWLVWAPSFALVEAWWPQAATAYHPAWYLAAELPPEAVPATTLEAALTVSARGRSYTYAESLPDKARARGLAAATHLIAPSADEVVLGWAEEMAGYRVLDRRDGWVLATWDADAVDEHRPAPARDAFSRVPRWRPDGASPLNPPGVPPPGCSP